VGQSEMIGDARVGEVTVMIREICPRFERECKYALVVVSVIRSEPGLFALVWFEKVSMPPDWRIPLQPAFAALHTLFSQ